jgi:hypothetical protein
MEIEAEISGVIHRGPKQCRERWTEQVDPSINHGPWTDDEDRVIADGRLSHVADAGSWVTIANGLPTTTATAALHRTPNGAKNRWKCAEIVRQHDQQVVKQAYEARCAAEQAAKAAKAEATKAAKTAKAAPKKKAAAPKKAAPKKKVAAVKKKAQGC